MPNRVTPVHGDRPSSVPSPKQFMLQADGTGWIQLPAELGF
jgi:hypothetical protein